LIEVPGFIKIARLAELSFLTEFSERSVRRSSFLVCYINRLWTIIHVWPSKLDFDLAVSNLRIAERIHDGLSRSSGHLDKGTSIEHVDYADRLPFETCFIGDRANDVSWSKTISPSHTNKDSDHTGFRLFERSEGFFLGHNFPFLMSLFPKQLNGSRSNLEAIPLFGKLLDGLQPRFIFTRLNCLA
jgi:hypothetical protein